MVYIAFLRGVNVGGKSTVNMASLKSCFEKLGFGNIKTYINSGNVIFSFTEEDTDDLAERIEDALDQEFDPGIRVLVKTREELQWIAGALPADWVNNGETRCDVMFLWPEADRPEVLKDMPNCSDLEDVRYIPGAVVWRIDREFVTKSRMSRIIGTDLYKQMTARNATTVRKLVSLANEVR